MDFKPQNAKHMDSLADAVAVCKDAVIEPKYDGWRMLTTVDDDGVVHVESRRRTSYTRQVPVAIMRELEKLPAGTIVDGEVVDLTAQDCTAVTNVFGKSKAKPSQEQIDKLGYVLFDILRVGNADATKNPLKDRRTVLGEMLKRCKVGSEKIRLTPQLVPTQEAHDSLVKDHGFEGVIVKDVTKPYAKGKRGHGWYKLKAVTDIDVVIMALPVDGKGKYAGQVGRMIVGQLVDDELVERAKVNCPNEAERLEMTIHPDRFLGRVATIKYYALLKDGLRHPTFQRWRPDKLAEDCTFHNA